MCALPNDASLRRAGLSEDEIRMLPLLVENVSLREIAASTGLAVAEVRTQADSIFRKLGVDTYAERRES